MNDQNHLPGLQPSKKRGRRFLRWLGGIVAGLLILSLLGAVYELAAEAADARTYPPPGQLVDVGGYRLHIYCMGTGSPTVVIEAGLGDWSTMWGSVQAEAAKTTQVCAYDRAGSGWSDSGPLPRDAGQFAKELHTLLQKADLPGPFVLVGHSLGGLPVRVFAGEYPAEVAGVVLIDSMFPGQGGHSSTEANYSGKQSNPCFFADSDIGAFRRRACAGKTAGRGRRHACRADQFRLFRLPEICASCD